MSERATMAGTKRFAKRWRERAAEEHFREASELVVSSIGIGTYLGQPDPHTDAAYTEAIVIAVENGINFVDSAINYRFQRSERSIGAALQQLAAKGVPREEIVVCTKGGYLTPDGAMPTDANQYFFHEYIQPGIFSAKDIAGGSHCMTPRFLENQLGRSLKNLGVECVDVYYLHNPESQLGEVTKNEFAKRVRDAFTCMEYAAQEGKIQYYGMATWNGFRQDERARDSIQLAELELIAKEIAGDKHRFRFVQLPFNLGMTEALTLGNQKIAGKPMTIMEAASELGITLVASASLLQGQVTRNLPLFVAQALGLENDAERALQFVRSAPGITTALVGMSRAKHALANARLVSIPPATLDQFSQLFSRGESA
ncbi:MAG TPA: aldo/keto reductase [Candidatus Sulfotelmatobacter sp.]|jgi:aryl-alcohol dehydrogenase-like predicted oxidoreductase|nr:aldo/keto reductase [Candidatus Sulfotelmatobacter sp.]